MPFKLLIRRIEIAQTLSRHTHSIFGKLITIYAIPYTNGWLWCTPLVCVLLVLVPLALRRTARGRCVFESIFKFRTIIFCIIALFNDITAHMPSYIVPCPSSYGAVLKKIKKKNVSVCIWAPRCCCCWCSPFIIEPVSLSIHLWTWRAMTCIQRRLMGAAPSPRIQQDFFSSITRGVVRIFST